MKEVLNAGTEAKNSQSIDYWGWFSRMAAYDLPTLLMFAGSVIQIARVFPQAVIYQVVVLSIGPIIGYFGRC